MNLQFENLWILLLLWTLPVIALWWYSAAKKREKKIAEFMSIEMQTKLRPTMTFQRLAWQTGLVITGLALSIIAAARPQWGTKEQTVFQRGRDLVIAIDVSRSMLAEDVHPNRLKRAKIDIRDIVKELRGDRAALIAFRYKAVLLCPLTTDYAYFNYALESVDIDSAPRGETDIGDAIIKAMEAFEDDSGSHKAIILISDGEDLTGRAIEAAKKSGEKKIPIFTVGLGDPNGAPIPQKDSTEAYVKHEGKEVKTKLDNSTLYEMAKASGGAYIPAQTAAMDLGTIYSNHLRKISEQDMEESIKRLHVERYQLFLFPALLCLIAAGCLSRGRLGKAALPLETKQLIIILLCMFTLSANAQSTNTQLSSVSTPPSLSTSTNTQVSSVSPHPLDIPPGREGARMAQKDYKLGNYKKAAEIYLEAAKESTAKSQRDFKYNAAVAYYNAGEYEKAAEILRELDLATTTSDESVLSGLGASMYQHAKKLKQQGEDNAESIAKLLKESGESFRNAARAEGSSETTLRNLSVILDQLPEAEENALISKLLKKHEQTSASELSAQMLNDQREIEKEMKKSFANNDPSQVLQLEQLAQRQKKNSELWIPLKQKMLQAMAQQEQEQQKMAAAAQNIERIREKMKKASSELRDMDTMSFDSVYASKRAIYEMWKAIADYRGLLHEDIRLQSNTIHNTSSKLPDTQILESAQSEAIDLTKLFTERFTQAVPEGGSAPSPAPPTTNSVSAEIPLETGQQGISAQDRAKILDLAKEAVITQTAALQSIKDGKPAESLPKQQKSYDILKEIEKLLPKDQQNQQDQQQNQQNQQDQQDQQNQQDQQDEQDKQDSKDQQKNQEEEKQPQTQEQEKPDQDAEDVRELLQKALQREKEHESEKRKRNRSIPLSPRERDW